MWEDTRFPNGRVNRHINASKNLLQTAVSKGMAGGLWFSPGAFQHDVMMALYDPEKGARSEPNGTSCAGEAPSGVITR